VEQSLVQQREEGGEARFGMLQVIREFALERLEATGASSGAASVSHGRPEAEAIRGAHLAYYLALGDQFLAAENATWSTLEMRDWFVRIEREHDNFRAALAWALTRATEAHQPGGAPMGSQPYLEAGLRLAGDLLWFWSMRGHLVERREWLESFLALDAPDDTADLAESAAHNREALAVRARAVYGATFGVHDERTVPRLERSIALYRAVGDRRGMAMPLRVLATAAALQGDRARATALLEECVLLCREVFGPLGAMHPITGLGELALLAGDLDQAQARSEEALALSLQADDLEAQAQNLVVQALIARRRGLLERAAAQVRKAVELLRAANDMRSYAPGLELCAIVLAARGQAEAAPRLLGAAAAHLDRLGMPWRGDEVPARAEIEAGTVEVRAALGEEAWSVAFAAGRALSVEDAIGEALKVSAHSATLPHVALGNIASRRK
jgi:tetratricopeptide (TPR) repeat protein